MKRKDALRKLRTICQRLDGVDPETFHIRPLRLYLFGSVLTDKPDPKDINLLLVYDDPSGYDRANIYNDMLAGRPFHFQRAITHLRKGMKWVNVEVAELSLENWPGSKLLLKNPIRPIWEPGADWAAVLAGIETSPLPWSGPRAPDSLDLFKAYIQSLSHEELKTVVGQVVAAAEAQQLPVKKETM